MTDESIQLATLFEEHRHGLTGAVRGMLGRTHDAQEVLQESFVRALRAVREGRVHGDPIGFIYVVTLNHARDLRRRRTVAAHSRPLDEVAEMELKAKEPPPTAHAEQQEAIAAARSAIERLGDREKEVFFLRVNAGLTFEGVASQLEIPVGTAKTRMRHALATLRRRLAPHGELQTGDPER